MGAMRVLRDGDRVVVLARSLEDGDGNVFIEPWSPALLPAHRVAEPGPLAVPITRWPAGPVVVDDVVVGAETVPGQVWRIEGIWRSGTVEFISRTLTEHPRAKHFRRGPSPTAGRTLTWTSPLDGAQQAALEQKRAEGLVVTSYPSKNPDGEVVYTIFADDPPAIRDALDLRPDQRVSVEPSPWTAATVEGTRAALIDSGDEWHLHAFGTGRGVAGRPPVLTASVAWLEPELLELYQATPLGLLELDVWISPAAAR
jgi:hypothetical protein